MTQDTRTEPHDVVEADRSDPNSRVNIEDRAWDWLEGMVESICDEHVSDIAYSADQMVDAYVAGTLAFLSTPPKADEGLDSKRLDWLQSESADVRWHSDSDDGIILEIVGHWQAEPCERLLAMNCHEGLRDAIDEAMTGQVLEQPPIGPRVTALNRINQHIKESSK
jgi:hypothetical protein